MAKPLLTTPDHVVFLLSFFLTRITFGLSGRRNDATGARGAVSRRVLDEERTGAETELADRFRRLLLLLLLLLLLQLLLWRRRGAADGERTPDAVAGDRRRRRSTARSARRAQRSEKVDLLERLRRRRRHWKFPHKNEMVNGSVLLDGEQANRFDGIYDRTKEIRCVVLSLNGRRDNGEMLRREESAS